jgi:hypothetical protein
MPAMSLLPLLRQIADGVYRNISELVRTSAIYLGIAVLVIVVMAWTMPVLRTQITQMHRSVIVTLAPEPSDFDDSIAPAQEGPMVSAVQLEAIPGARLPPSPTQTDNKSSGAVKEGGPGKTISDKPNSVQANASNRPSLRISADQTAATVNDSGLSEKTIDSLSNSQLDALVKYISRKYLVSQDASMLFVDTAYSAGNDYKVDPLLLLAMMATESRFNPYAGGPRGGATGLLQIVSSVHREKINRFGRGESGVYHPVINTRIGAYILSECIRNRGSVNLGLACYCGATDPAKDGGYSEKVQSERRRMALAASIPVHD